MSNEINLVVTYVAAPTPFIDHNASPSETLAQLKARVLSAFELSEGTRPDGQVVSYTFYNGKDPLADLTVLLGALAGPAHGLKLKLSQVLTQGVGRR